MEHLDNEHLQSGDVLVAEHRHRYLWAAGYVRGDILDLACGYGYGAEILGAHCSVSSYVGMDVSAEAVRHAKQKFARPGRRYELASATEIPLPEASVDGIVSLETLEHLTHPSEAIAEFKRVLRPAGMLVGSVPSRYFDERAEAVYGPNPYHVTRFSHPELEALLSAKFRTVRIYYSALEVVTRIGSLEQCRPVGRELVEAVTENPANEVSGSFHFVATDRDADEIDALHRSRVYLCAALVDFEGAKVNPLRERVARSDELVVLKDEVLQQSAELVHARDGYILELEERRVELEKRLAEVEQRRLELEERLATSESALRSASARLEAVPAAVIRVFSRRRGKG